jgi:hypothetical protein
MTGLVPGHLDKTGTVPNEIEIARSQASKATPFFERLCPAMTVEQEPTPR